MHGLAYHLASVRGIEQQEILLDFARSRQSLRSDDQGLKVDPAQVDALIINHGRI
jgi:metal-dependent hydrolase (beta-lactamase superfamily II)